MGDCMGRHFTEGDLFLRRASPKRLPFLFSSERISFKEAFDLC
jgi:hypothetical protein